MVQFALDVGGRAFPSPSEVGYLSPEISGEGEKIIMSDGEDIAFTLPPAKPIIPDWSTFKRIKKYFNRSGYQVYPSWIYHPNEDAIVVKDAEEAKRYGIVFRVATHDERARYGIRFAWDYIGETKWRSSPYSEKPSHSLDKFSNVKNVIHKPRVFEDEQSALIETLIPQVAAAVAQALKITAPNAPPQIDQKDWAEFQTFLAWKQSAQAVKEAVADAAPSMDAVGEPDFPEQEESTDELKMWRAEAERLGIKVDGRWGLVRLQQEIEKVT